MAAGGGVAAARERLRYAEYSPPSAGRPDADRDQRLVSPGRGTSVPQGRGTENGPWKAQSVLARAAGRSPGRTRGGRRAQRGLFGDTAVKSRPRDRQR